MGLSLARIDEKYEVVAKIQEGGMGEIYKVRHRLLDEVRVVKVLHPELVGDSELNERFAREARAAIRLRHPNIVQIFDFTMDASGSGLIVMEYIRGVDLKRLIRRRRPPSIELVIEVARQGLRALGFLHRSGFVHRDVSPDNLMLSVDVEGRPLVKVIDLGIAKRRGAESQLTASGMFLGKFRYSSPEHFGAQGSDGIEARSDLYTFGLVLYELLTGCYPIRGETMSQLIAGHLFQPPHDFERTDPDGRVPDGLRRVVMKMLAKEPGDRFTTAEELITELDALQADHPITDLVLTESRRYAAGNDTTAEIPASRIVAQRRQERDARGPDPDEPTRTTTPASQTEVKALFQNAESLVQLKQLEAARSQLEEVLGLAPDHTAARELKASLDDELARREAELETLVTEVEDLLQSGKLIEADRILFQAQESHGPVPELTPVRQRLDDLFKRGVESEVRELIDQAAAATRDEEITRALEILDKARSAAPPASPLAREVASLIEEAQAASREQHTRRQQAAIRDLEQRLLALIQRRDFAAARQTLVEARGDLGSAEGFEPLRQLLARTVAERIENLVQKAGVALDGEHFAKATELLEEALNLDRDNDWIRSRLERARQQQRRHDEEQQRQEKQHQESSRYVDEARVAHRDGDVLKARLLVARSLELWPENRDGATLAQALDREHRAVELQRSTLQTTPFPPGLMKAYTDIEAQRAAGDPVAAWRLLGSAIAEFGENEALVALRRQVAEEILEADESQAE